jgi:CheY-like chemotaxis protein
VIDAKVTILIVDDDPSVRFSLGQIFQCMGHSVRTAEDGFSALREMRETMPDILLSDLNMPHMSGFELLSVIRRRFPSVYVIAMSGANLRGGIPAGIAADGFYEKASGVVALLKAVENGATADRLSLLSSRKSTPIWVSRPGISVDRSSILERQEENRRSESKQVMIGCPECLRSFAQAMDTSGSLLETVCLHCCTAIHYAVVEQFASVM